MRLFRKVAVIGTGLIGGSLALDMKKKGLAVEIVGLGRRDSTLLSAKRMGAIDRGSRKPEIIKGADLVVLAAPVETIINLAGRLAKFINKSCIVTDVGSTKAEIVSRLDKIFPNYAGSHPLTGSEKRGILSARPGIFRGSLCILTPTAKTSRRALKKINSLWRQVGAKTVLLEPQAHDRILAFTSHLPHIVAFSLIDAIPAKYLGLSSTGLRDTTRIAASESEIWSQVLLTNRRNVLRSIGAFRSNLARIESAIKRKDEKALRSALKKAKRKKGILG